MTVVASLTTVQLRSRPNILWVLVETDDGCVGLGETFFITDAVAGYGMRSTGPG